MCHHLSLMAGGIQFGGHRLGPLAVFLGADPDPVQRTGLGLQLAQKCRESLFAEIRCQAIRVGLIRETAELDGPHAGR